jgi:hypothetical protein
MSTANDRSTDSVKRTPLWLSEVVERFEQAWQNGQRPPIEEFLPADPVQRHEALARLVYLDLEFRLMAGELVAVEAYFGRYPELATDPNAALDLIVAEYRLRQRRDPTLNTAEFFRRFPRYRDQLAARLPGSAEAASAVAARPAYIATPTTPPLAQPVGSAPSPLVTQVRTAISATPGSLRAWLHRAERLTEAGTLSVCTAVALGLLALCCVISVLVIAQRRLGFLPMALATTTCIVGLAVVHVWIGLQTLAKRLWAVWAGAIVAVLEVFEILRWVANQGFQIDPFFVVVCAPLMIVFLIQLTAYLVALRAFYANWDVATVPRSFEEAPGTPA